MMDKANNGRFKDIREDLSNSDKATNTQGPIGEQKKGIIMNEVGLGSLAEKMMSNKGTKKQLSKRFLEIRFKPNPQILDIRGKIAEALSIDPFDSWSVSTNSVSLKNNHEKYINGYFSFTNLGFLLRRSAPSDEFEGKVREFVKNAWGFFPSDTITRIGIRSIYFSEIRDFNRAFRKFQGKFLKLSKDELQKFGGDLVDVGFPLNFKTGNRCFNIMTGPMEKSQAKEKFGTEEELPQTGVYVDVDYFESDFKHSVRQKAVFDLIRKGIAKADEINKLIYDMVS